MSEPVPPAEKPNVGAAVAKAGAILAISILLSRILGVVRDIVMTSQFGIGLETDAYRIAVQIPDMIFMLIAGGGLSSAFLPIFSELIHTDREKEAWRVFSTVTTMVCFICAAVIGIAWVFTPQLVDFFRGNHPDEVVPEAIYLSHVMLPGQFAFVVGSLLIATLYARKYYLVPSLSPNVYNVGMIGGALIMPAFFGWGIESMAWGAVIGAVAGSLVMPAIAMAKVGSSFRPMLDWHLPGVKKFFVLMAPIIFGFSLPSMVNIVTQKFASVFGQPGVNTVLNLSANIMQAPLGIFGQSLALAAFPVLAEFFAKKQMDLYRESMSKTIRQVLYLGIPSGVIFSALAPQIANALFDYGRASQSPQELQWTAQALAIYGVGVWAWCVQPVLMRGFFSLQQTFQPLLISTGMTLLFIALCQAAVQMSRTNFLLIPWATNIAVVVSVLALYFYLERNVGKLDRPGVILTFGKSLAASLAMAAFAYLALNWVPKMPQLAEVLLLGFVLICSAWVYYFATKKLGMPETAYLDRAFARAARRPRNSA